MPATPSTGPFAAFDYPYKIELLRVTRGKMNQTTGAWIAPSETTVEIAGNIQFKPLSEREDRNQSGWTFDGDGVLFSEYAGLKVGDRLKIHLDNSGTNFIRFFVKAIRSNLSRFEQFGLTAQRYEYTMTREDDKA